MGMIRVLDCTLRDGGYVNDWVFGRTHIERMIGNLERASIDIIECGFLENVDYNPSSSVFPSVELMSSSFEKKDGVMYVGMIALGDIDVDMISPRSEKTIDGIRLTFHKNELEEEFEQAKKLMEKGYEVFIQPVGTTNYSDIDLLNLIAKVNELKPFAFYIVDTLGVLYPNDIVRIFSIVDNNLDRDVAMGFHSHNNLQLSFSNAQTLIDCHFDRTVIIDSSVMGMGRGAGNLCTELIVQYINKIHGFRYDVLPLLNIMDETLIDIRKKYNWGYSAHHYLSAISGCHPNYATYLLSKKTLDGESICKILNSIPVESRGELDKNLINGIYLGYQESKIDDAASLTKLEAMLSGVKIVVIAPGESIVEYRESIREHCKGAFCIHINGEIEGVRADAVFYSNRRKYGLHRTIDNNIVNIVTSNINCKDDAIVVDYSSLLCGNNDSDNAGVMLLNLLEKVGVLEVELAGFDGYSQSNIDRSSYDSLADVIKEADRRNDSISSELKRLAKKMDLHFITPSRYTIG